MNSGFDFRSDAAKRARNSSSISSLRGASNSIVLGDFFPLASRFKITGRNGWSSSPVVSASRPRNTGATRAMTSSCDVLAIALRIFNLLIFQRLEKVERILRLQVFVNDLRH